MALSPGEMHARILKNLPEKTGQSLDYWLGVVSGFPAAMSIKEKTACLKTEYGLGHYTAVAILKQATEGNAYENSDRLVSELFAPQPPEARSLFNQLDKIIYSLGNDIRQTPCKTYIGYSHTRQFIIVRPVKTGSLELGLVLPYGYDALLSPAKNFGSRRIRSYLRINSADTAVKKLLAASYQFSN